LQSYALAFISDSRKDSAFVNKLEASGQPVQGGFYAGVMFDMESARDELASAIAAQTTDIQ